MATMNIVLFNYLFLWNQIDGLQKHFKIVSRPYMPLDETFTVLLADELARRDTHVYKLSPLEIISPIRQRYIKKMNKYSQEENVKMFVRHGPRITL